MKKQLKLIVAALAATAIATPAFALTAETKGFLEIRGLASRNLVDGTNNTADDDVRGVEQRLRIWTEAAANENVKAVLGLEIDNIWGQSSVAALDGGAGSLVGGNKQVGSPGSDAKGQLEIKHVYLDFTVPQFMKANVKAGTQYFKQGNGFIAGEDATGAQIAVPMGNNALKLIWIKTVENNGNINSDDGDYYSVQYDAKLGNFNFNPYLGYEVPGKNTEVYYAGFDFGGKLSDTSKVAFTAIKNFGEGPAVGAGKVDGIALYGGFFQAMGKNELSVEGAFVGDNGEAHRGGEFRSPGNLGLYQPTEFLGGARYDRRVFFGNNLGGAGGADLYNMNFAMLKLTYAATLNETSKLTGYLAHIQEAFGDRSAASEGGLMVYGQELGVYYDYTVVKNLNFNLMGAYLVNDDFGTGDDNAYKLGTALTYKF